MITVPPPPVNGLGTIGGFKVYVEDRADLGSRRAVPEHTGAHRQGRSDAGTWRACSQRSQSMCRSSMQTSTA